MWKFKLFFEKFGDIIDTCNSHKYFKFDNITGLNRIINWENRHDKSLIHNHELLLLLLAGKHTASHTSKLEYKILVNLNSVTWIGTLDNVFKRTIKES